MTAHQRKNEGETTREYFEMQTTLRSPSEKRIPFALKKQEKVTANLWHMIVYTPYQSIRDTLNSLNISSQDINNMINLHDFYNAILNLSVAMEDPSVISLEWFRLNLAFSEPATVLKIAPDSQGVKTKIKKYGERKLTINPSLEIGASFEHAASSQKQTESKDNSASDSYKFTVGPKLGITGSYDRKKGWEIEYEKTIDEIRGVMNGRREIIWDIYCDPNLKLPADKFGKTVNAKTAVTIMVQKGHAAEATIRTRGKAMENVSFWFDREAPIKFVGPNSISIKPDFPRP